MRIRLVTDQITDRPTFHNAFKSLMGFPDYYGMNMDAWIDCMSDLEHMTKFRLKKDEMLHVEILGAEEFRKRLPSIFEALVDCSAFVNKRFVATGEAAILALIFL